MLDPTSEYAKTNIRRATLADYDALSVMFAEIDQHHAAALPEIFRWTGQPLRTRERIAELLAREDANMLVAEIRGEIVGLVMVVERQAPETLIHVPRRVVHVADLVVRASYRRHGIGGALLEAAEEWAEKRGINEVELNVFEFNRSALAFYDRQGYTTLSRLMRKSLGGADEGAREN